MISIREITENDLLFLMTIRNLQMDVLRQNQPLDIEHQLKWFENIIKPSQIEKYPQTRQFMIIDPQRNDNQPIGYGGLCYIDYQNRRTELSFLLDTTITKEGDLYYSQVLKLFVKEMIKVAFDQLKLNRIYGETYQYRQAHLKALEDSGFVYEGRLRKHFYKNGQFHDSLIHSIIVDDIKS
jgi:RimJ/RimL family protein N-acetyltransferase